MTRSISYSEASVLLDCQAKHDFSYVGQLAGDSLKPLVTHKRLREGKAWGRAMAAYHSNHGIEAAHRAIDESVYEDASEMLITDQDEQDEMLAKLHAILDHYANLTAPISITKAELELDVPIPSRGGKRASNRYRFTGFVDGIQTDTQGNDWIVEFKLRGQLSSVEQVALGRQIRWYAWAWRKQTGRPVAGIIVEERLNDAPKPARILANGLPSHTEKQATTPELYAKACADAGIPASQATMGLLAQRRWGERHFIFLRDWELAEAGRQITSMAALVSQFDSHQLFPVRNPSQFRCPGCAFRDICGNPSDSDLVDALFERVPAKRDRKKAAA